MTILMVLGACGTRRLRVAWYYVRITVMLAPPAASWVYLIEPIVQDLTDVAWASTQAWLGGILK